MEYIVLIIAAIIALVLVFIRFRPKLTWPKPSSSPTPTAASTAPVAPAPAPTAPAPAKAKTSWTWLKWIINIGVLITLTLIIGSCFRQMVMDVSSNMPEKKLEERVKEKQPDFPTSGKILTNFTPEHVGEWKIGRLSPGEYIYTVDGQYQKKWSDKTYSSIDGATGIWHQNFNLEKYRRIIPFPEIHDANGKGYGLIFLRIGRQYVFPGDKFTISAESDVFAEPNIIRSTEFGNYENTGSVKIIIEPAKPATS